MGVVQRITMFGASAMIGFGQGFQPVCGFCYGAQLYDRVKKGFWFCVRFSTLFLLCISCAGFIFAPQLIGIFTQSPEVIATGSRVLRNIMFILPFVGAVSMSRMSFQAMGKPQYAFGITLVRQLVLYVPLLLILNRLFGFSGMIKAQPVTELIMMIVSISLLRGVILRQQAERDPDQQVQ
jgi:Na+-driven multidrug efflux pump